MKKVLTGLVAAVVLITAAAYNLIYTTAADGDKTGSCGESVTWSFDETTGVLTISGTGDMYTNYVPYDQWGYYQYKDEITEVVVEEGITYISECAFGPFDPNAKLCREPPIYSQLTKLTLSSSVKSIGSFAFYKSGLTSVTFSEGIETIGDAAFKYTSLLGNLILPKSLNRIGDHAFRSTNITSINLNEGMNLGGGAFRDCDYIKEVTIPSNVYFNATYLDSSNAPRQNCGFSQCDSLEKVIIQGGGEAWVSLSTKEHAIGEDLFSQCPLLKEVEIETEDIEYVSSDTFDMANNPTFKVYKGSTTEQTLKDAGYLTAENTIYYDVDATELEDAIAKAKEIDTSKYTDESVSLFEKALTEAQALLNQEYSLPSEVNGTIKSLNDAIATLVEKSTKPSSEQPPSNDSSNNTNSISNPLNKTLKVTSAKTGAEKMTNTINAIKKAKIKKLSLKSISKKKIKVTWKKVNKAKGYQVQVSKKKNFKKKLFNKFTSKKKLIFSKKLKTKKIYYVRVRAYYTYRNRNNEIQNAYSRWSKKLKVKIK